MVVGEVDHYPIARTLQLLGFQISAAELKSKCRPRILPKHRPDMRHNAHDR